MSRNNRPPQQSLARLSVERLEDRSTPATYAVNLTSDTIGIHGDSSGYVVSGGLETDPALRPYETGVVYVDASSPQEAIRQAIVGTIHVSVNGSTITYVFNPATARLSPSEQSTFFVTEGDGLPPNSPPPSPTSPITNWQVKLEDLSSYPNQADWDYNDHYWTVEVMDLTDEPAANGPGAISGHIWADDTRDERRNVANDTPKPNTLVTLYTSTGREITSALTDINGRYSFVNLPFGNYRVVVEKAFFESFVQQHYGNGQYSSTDSDVDEYGRSGVVPVTQPGTPQYPSAHVDGGVFLSQPPANALEGKPIIMRPTDNGPATELKVAKWGSENSTSTSDSFESDGMRPVEDARARLKGVKPNGHDFIDNDKDRFNVFVKDTAAAQNGQATRKVKISTKNTPANAAYDDDETELTLVKMNIVGWDNWYWSDSQILVSNETDDKYSKAVVALPGGGFGGGVATDDQPPTNEENHKNLSQHPVSDRTHIIALNGTVEVSHVPHGQVNALTSSYQVKIRKQVKVTAYILKDNAGAAVTTAAAVDADIKNMREIYAQVGINIIFEGAILLNSPRDVNLADGMDAGGPLTDEQKALLNGTNRTAATQGGTDDIEVWYVNRFAPNRYAGMSLSTARTPIAQFANMVMIAATRKKWSTLAHEVTHVLERIPLGREDHQPYAGVVQSGLDTVNLMVGGLRSVNHNIRAVNDSRRLTQD